MNKAELKKKWFKYCDTDKLFNDMANLLRRYNYSFSDHGICTLLDKYFEQKEPLIKMFIKSKNYIGNMRIVSEREFERQVDSNEIYRFFNRFHDEVSSYMLIKNVDSDGKGLLDYLSTCKKAISIDCLPKADEQKTTLAKMRVFNYHDRNTKESSDAYDYFCGYVNRFSRIYYPTIQDDWTADPDNKNLPVIKRGTKTSRAFNAVCTHFGVDKLNPQLTTVERNGQVTEKVVYPYNKVFAEYSDLVSDLKRKMRFVISLNPLDYLTMSFGVSWISCHNISSGGWRGGCLSYMLDRTSMITFVVNNTDDTPIHEIPKLYRQMYHYEDNLFIQNRLYPQGNDGATDLYSKFRGFVIEEFSDIMNVDGEWDVQRGAATVSSHTRSFGVHYRDYGSNNSCSIFYPVAKATDVANKVMNIGHDGICIKCGHTYSKSNRLNHQYTSECESAALEEVLF